MDKTSIGDRMKNNYEKIWKTKLPMRMPVIIRLDGKSFHTLTKKLSKPFDKDFINIMDETAVELCKNIQGAQIAYVASDEISILLHNYKKLNSDAWFGNQIQKMTSISAAIASTHFTNAWNHWYEDEKNSYFDSRVFVLPENEVCNYFIWRQNDWTRNSVQMVARSVYSHKECHKKNNSELQEMVFQKGINWDSIDTSLKRGRAIIKNQEESWVVDKNIPIFTQDRNYIEENLKVEENGE